MNTTKPSIPTSNDPHLALPKFAGDPHEPFRIMLVDDQIITARMLERQLLGEVDLTLLTTTDPLQAVSLAERWCPAVLLLDLVMPGIDGLAMLEQFRALEAFRDLPILMLSSVEDAHQKAQAFASGANDYLVKLPDRVELLARLRYHARAYLSMVEREKVQRVLWDNECRLREQATRLLELERATSHARSDFMANLSHEIRTPMNAILGLTDLALRANPDPGIQDYLQKIATASRSLMGCLNDILDFSKIEAGRLDLYPVLFNPGEVFNRLAITFGSQAANNGIELVFIIPDNYFHTLFGDHKRLEQIFINLLRNALKFTDHGTVVVRAYPHPGRVGPVSIHFSVEDTGIGIAQATPKK